MAVCGKGGAWVAAPGLIIGVLIVANKLYLLDVILSHTDYILPCDLSLPIKCAPGWVK